MPNTNYKKNNKVEISLKALFKFHSYSTVLHQNEALLI